MFLKYQLAEYFEHDFKHFSINIIRVVSEKLFDNISIFVVISI